MAKGPVKKGSGGFRLPNKWMKYLIILVGLTMLLSGLYSYGISKEMPAGTDDPNAFTFNEVDYDSAQVMPGSAIAKIVEATGQLKLKPNQIAGLDQRDFQDVFESNITGVSNIVFENSRGGEMFHFETAGGNVTDEINKRIRITGGYKLYRVYKGTTPYGSLDIIGDGLSAGDYVNVILYQRTRANSSETIGFTQFKVPTGPIINATVAGDFDGYGFSGVSQTNISGQLAAAINGTKFSVEENKDDATNGTYYAVSFSMPNDTDVAAVLDSLKSLNMANLTVSKVGYVRTVDMMIVNGKTIAIQNPGRVHAILGYDRKANATVRVQVNSLSLGNQSITYAREV